MGRKTLLIISQNHEPSFNLAAEEHLLKKFDEDILFFYINKPSVIIGKHQNALSEINHRFLEQNRIPVHRRLSGGGTVYHDEGNINFCVIEWAEPGKLVDFKKATAPIVTALNHRGLEVTHGKRNELLLGDKKISGNACHVFKSRSLHHGTLLYNANLQFLNESIRAEGFRFTDRSVKSVRSEVTNMADRLSDAPSAEIFMEQLGLSVIANKEAAPYTFTSEDVSAIRRLQREKYDTWAWNYGYSPVYEFKKSFSNSRYTLSAHLKVEKGEIISAQLDWNLPDKTVLKNVARAITGKFHEKQQLRTHVTKTLLQAGNPGNLRTDTILEVLF